MEPDSTEPSNSQLSQLQLDVSLSPLRSDAVHVATEEAASDNGPPCLGITTEFIAEKVSKYQDEISRGFHHLVGNALRDKGHFVSHHQKWPHERGTAEFLREKDANSCVFLSGM